jgi:hypothetical protein
VPRCLCNIDHPDTQDLAERAVIEAASGCP